MRYSGQSTLISRYYPALGRSFMIDPDRTIFGFNSITGEVSYMDGIDPNYRKKNDYLFPFLFVGILTCGVGLFL